ncbi:hypothetical protein WJX73_001215 [Symbiochloris irregularis]|uniref:EsV-1-7 n=1 Tax=Symbiochloris irregularis TaxID=706552 RepID=A0AAW1NT37_9CHLO
METFEHDMNGVDGRLDVKSPRCSHPDCTKQSIYNLPGSSGAILCSHHKEPGMVDVVHKLCAHPDCHTQPNYNYPDKKGGVFCSQHKEPGMVDVNNKRCAHPGCNKSAWCNHVGQRGGLFCSQHKMPGMIYITNMLCAQEGCRKRPGYNFPGESTTGKYCSQHKLEGMVDVKHKPCQYENCTKRPYFNYQGETHGILCNEHKQPGMINVGQAPCAEPGCHLAPSFNFPGQKKRLFCAQHKLEGMVNISQQPRSQLSAAAELAQQGHVVEEPMVHGLVDAYGHEQATQADMSQLGMDGGHEDLDPSLLNPAPKRRRGRRPGMPAMPVMAPNPYAQLSGPSMAIPLTEVPAEGELMIDGVITHWSPQEDCAILKATNVDAGGCPYEATFQGLQVVLSVQMGGPTRTSAQIRERYRFLSTRLFWSFAQYVQQAAVPQPDYASLQGDQRYYQHMQSSEGMVVNHDGQLHDASVYQHSQAMEVPGMHHPGVHDHHGMHAGAHEMHHATGHEDVHGMHHVQHVNHVQHDANE